MMGRSRGSSPAPRLGCRSGSRFLRAPAARPPYEGTIAMPVLDENPPPAYRHAIFACFELLNLVVEQRRNAEAATAASQPFD